MILEHYTGLYVRYIELWQKMYSKVSKDIIVMEFMNMTIDRPGANHSDEPWSDAKAFVTCIVDKLGSITPRTVGEACVHALKTVSLHLSQASKHFAKHKSLVDIAIEDVRVRLLCKGGLGTLA